MITKICTISCIMTGCHRTVTIPPTNRLIQKTHLPARTTILPISVKNAVRDTEGIFSTMGNNEPYECRGHRFTGTNFRREEMAEVTGRDHRLQSLRQFCFEEVIPAVFALRSDAIE